MGNNAGNRINNPSEYDTARFARVARANTFLLASRTSDSIGLGRSWEGTVFTRGNGVNQNTTDNRAAIGAESAANRKADVDVHTHTQMAVDYRFGPDGSIGTTTLTGTKAADVVLVADTRTGGTVARAADWRVPSSRTPRTNSAPPIHARLIGYVTPALPRSA